MISSVVEECCPEIRHLDEEFLSVVQYFHDDGAFWNSSYWADQDDRVTARTQKYTFLLNMAKKLDLMR